MRAICRDRNNCTLNGVEVSVIELKSLFKLSCILGTSNMHSLVDFTDSMSFRL